ncbi:MAG: DNA alkylation repair protein [bacterium]
MKYFAVNEHLESEIKSIKQEIRLSMNGICSENMGELGLNYKINFGVNWIRLQNIAKTHTQNYELAVRLWAMPIRETKLMATLLCPPNEMTAERLKEWIEGITTPELAEIIAMSLLSKNATLSPYIIKLLDNDDNLIKLTALNTMARTVKNLSNDDLRKIILILPTNIEDISTYRATEALLLNIILHTNELDNNISEWLKKIEQSNSQHSQLLYKVIKEELEYR